MRGAIRSVAALVLAIGLAAAPLAADWCAASCEAVHAGQTSGARACHHTSPTTARVGRTPSPCGHDHHPVTLDTATPTTVAPVGVLPVDAWSAPTLLWPDRRISPSVPLPLALASSLRI